MQSFRPSQALPRRNPNSPLFMRRFALSLQIPGDSHTAVTHRGATSGSTGSKRLQRSGTINAIWANHKGIGLGEEIQLWMTYGWSTLGFGCELWPWGDCLWAEKVESVLLRTRLGVSSKASYPAMCWEANTDT